MRLKIPALIAAFLVAASAPLPLDGQAEGEPLITLNAPSEDLHVLLDAVAEQAGFSISVPFKISDKVTVRLREVTLRQALDAILAPNGYHYVINGKVITVFDSEMAKDNARLQPAEEMIQWRLFELKHIPAKGLEKTVLGMLTKERGIFQIIPAHVTRGWEVGEQVGEPVTPAAPVGVIAPQQNLLDESRSYRFLVRDVPAVLGTIEQMVAKVDVPQRQVYISVVIFEMNHDEQEEIGFRWRISLDATGSALPWNFPFGRHDAGEYRAIVDPADPLAPSVSGRAFPDVPGDSNLTGVDGGFIFGSVKLTSTQLLAELNRLGAETNIVSNPRLMVGDNQEAVILVGERFPIFRTTITDQGTVTESFDRYEPIGIQMQVVPHILENGQVEVALNPQVTSLGNLVIGTTGLTSPRISTREVSTVIRVEDGASIVIGGLVTDRNSETKTETPWLSAIPILGRLFTHEAKSKQKVDLVVVLTPYVDGLAERHDLQRELEKSRAGARAQEPAAKSPSQ
ncbi:MAG: secretin and TonB N-terminal domain-containing protein [Planctomycetes bacterium]|nr:secretin and TonB N-terminal domain-containing protein [Planctomycetota bacterium]